MRQIPAKIWLPVIALVLIAVGLTVFFTWPREEKVPEIIAPEITPEEEIAPPEGIVWNVPAGQVDRKVEKEIQKVVFEYFSPEPVVWEGGEQIVTSIDNLKVEEEWAVFNYARRYKETGEFVGAGPGFMLLRKVNQYWEKGDNDEKFCQWLPLVPESILSSDVKVFYLDLCEQKE